MTEDEARLWLQESANVSRETLGRIERFADILIAENDRQNLIAPASIDHIWARHIVDSAQLVFAKQRGLWIDIGSGAGLPGLVIAMMRDAPMLLVEPRRKRADFLSATAAALGLKNVTVAQSDIRKVQAHAAVISARAVAATTVIFDMAAHLSRPETQWVLPKGRNALNELESARDAWQGVFEVKPSVTETGSMIIVATGIARKQP
jgi:16S rRNA (guanine527-N7)-methyltransferase